MQLLLENAAVDVQDASNEHSVCAAPSSCSFQILNPANVQGRLASKTVDCTGIIDMVCNLVFELTFCAQKTGKA
jgi:hypothetical protein